jgi:hypothetical protein
MFYGAGASTWSRDTSGSDFSTAMRSLGGSTLMRCTALTVFVMDQGIARRLHGMFSALVGDRNVSET